MESSSCASKKIIQPRFTEEDDEKLIFEVSGRELLWKLSNTDYKNTVKKDIEWQKIGEKLGKTGKKRNIYMKS